MSEQKSFIDQFTDFIKSTTGLITAVGGLLTIFAGYGITHSGEVWPFTNPDAPTCTDGIKNGNESGVDCGGNCPPCGKGAFTNLERIIEESTGRLTKTSGGRNWNGGASSIKSLPAGAAGGVSYTIKQDDGHFLFGLSDTAGDAGFKSVKYALAVQPGADSKVQVNVFESGINRTKREPGQGARIGIHRAANGQITYTVDGMRVTDVPESRFAGSLLLDLSINHGGVSGLTLEGGWR